MGKTPFLLSVLSLGSMVGMYKVYNHLSDHPTSVCFDCPDTHAGEDAAVPCLGNGARRCPRLLDTPAIWLFGVCLEKESS
jgi:hypothetical protein